MGYHMELRDQDFKILAGKKAEALAAIKTLAFWTLKSVSSGVRVGARRCFSWVYAEEFVKAETFEKAMDAWRWSVESERNNGDIDIIYFDGEKLGDEAVLFDIIAPYVEDGSYIEMQGEDGARWRWCFVGGKCVQKNAEISWPDED